MGAPRLFPGFHKYLGDWWARVVMRVKQINGYVHGMAKVWEEEDATNFSSFTPTTYRFMSFHLSGTIFVNEVESLRTIVSKAGRFENPPKDIILGNKSQTPMGLVS